MAMKPIKSIQNLILNGSVEDNGTAIGAGLAGSIKLGCERKSSSITDYYGKNYSQREILDAVNRLNIKYEVLSEKDMIKIYTFLKKTKV